MMNFTILKKEIQQVSSTFRQSAVAAINIHLTVRNWLIGYYIVKFEQNGEDRVKYGAKLLQNLAEEIDGEGLSYQSLNFYRQIYIVYPQVREYLLQFLKKNVPIRQALPAQLKRVESQGFEILSSPRREFDGQNSFPVMPVEKLLHRLSFTHIKFIRDEYDKIYKH
jgi:hypothetical protein